MEKRQSGNTGMQITRTGFGAWAIGGGNCEFGWGPQDDSDAVAAIRHAIDIGMNWIDTAGVVGGRSAAQVEGIKGAWKVTLADQELEEL